MSEEDNSAQQQAPHIIAEGGIGAVAKYNPHLWTADELRAIFVARQRELAQILDSLRGTQPGSAPQHLLITGQRGMGKTTLLQRVALAVEDDPQLSKIWLPLRFPEEQYTVSTPAELWTNVLGALADALEHQKLSTAEIDIQLTQLTQSPLEQREPAALELLAQWCQNHQRRLLLLVDSTDLLFANLASVESNRVSQSTSHKTRYKINDKDAGATALWRVRKTLLHAPHLFWLGGSYQPLEAHCLYSDAFLDFFQLIALRPFTVLEMQATIQALAHTFGVGRDLKGAAAEAKVTRVLTERPERLHAMRQLSGGNPRITIMLYELFASGGQDSLRADLERLLDMMTPLYKARLEALADQARKVLAHLMEQWAPVTAKVLAQAASLPVGTISAQLTRLEQEGLVEKVSLGGTKRLGYQASERFFNIWYLMRNAPRSMRLRLGWLVEFMRLWYHPDELQSLASSRWRGQARLLGQQGRRDEASAFYRQWLSLSNNTEHLDFRLQAHCWLGNQDLALQALDTLAHDASAGDVIAFKRLKEQCFECHNFFGLGAALVDLMDKSRYAEFLQPFALALRAASGQQDALLGAVPEIRVMAEEVLQQLVIK